MVLFKGLVSSSGGHAFVLRYVTRHAIAFYIVKTAAANRTSHNIVAILKVPISPVASCDGGGEANRTSLTGHTTFQARGLTPQASAADDP